MHSEGTLALPLDEFLVPTKLDLTAASWDKKNKCLACIRVQSQCGLVGKLGGAGGSLAELLTICTPLRKMVGEQVA